MMGSLDMDAAAVTLSTLLSKLNVTPDADNVFSEMRPSLDLSASMLPRHLLSDSDSSSFFSSPLYQQPEVLLSPEPRFHSDPGRLEDIFEALQQQQQQQQYQQQHHPLVLTRSGTLHHQAIGLDGGMRTPVPDRRTCSLGDISPFAVSLQQQQQQQQPTSCGVYRKLSEAVVREMADAQQQQQQGPQRYKTELCRPFEEYGTCRYGTKCQFAHGRGELRNVSRHPKYKTEMCRTFHTTGICPYGPRCHFIHNSDDASEMQQQPPQSPHHHHQLSRQSSTVEQQAVAAAQIDIERRRTQLVMNMQLQKRDETQSDIEAAFRRSSYAATQWPSDHHGAIYQQFVDPPPGLPALDARSSSGTGGSSPISETSSMSSSFDVSSRLDSPTTSSAPHLSAYHHQQLLQSASCSSAFSATPSSTSGRPLLSATASLPLTSFYSTPVSGSIEQQRSSSAELLAVRAAQRLGDFSTCATSTTSMPEVQQAGWRCLGRRATVSPTNSSAWPTLSTRQHSSFDDSGCGLDADYDEVDLRRRMASMNPDKLAALLDLVRVCAPSSQSTSNAAVLQAALQHQQQQLQLKNRPTSLTARYGRSMSFQAPLSVPVDERQWMHPTPSPVNRAAGVCG